MRELNKKHMGHDTPTDVLSFPFLDIAAGQTPTRQNFPLDYNRKTKRVELGDIIINADEPNPEFLTAHGLLHLLGYHH
jgi:ssRNA-specific RNase YbeY (16S rRNA maturation enzyme)